MYLRRLHMKRSDKRESIHFPPRLRAGREPLEGSTNGWPLERRKPQDCASGIREEREMRGTLIKQGNSKRIFSSGDGLCVVELIPSLSSFTYSRYEDVEGTEVLRLDFYEMAAARLAEAGIHTAFRERVAPNAYLADLCSESPFEVIVKNVAQGSTTRKYPGLFEDGMRLPFPVVKFDYRTSPEDQPIAEDYVRAYGGDP